MLGNNINNTQIIVDTIRTEVQEGVEDILISLPDTSTLATKEDVKDIVTKKDINDLKTWITEAINNAIYTQIQVGFPWKLGTQLVDFDMILHKNNESQRGELIFTGKVDFYNNYISIEIQKDYTVSIQNIDYNGIDFYRITPWTFPSGDTYQSKFNSYFQYINRTLTFTMSIIERDTKNISAIYFVEDPQNDRTLLNFDSNSFGNKLFDVPKQTIILRTNAIYYGDHF